MRAHIDNNPSFAAAPRELLPFERVLVVTVGKDLGQWNSLVPRRVASSAVAGLRELYESDEAQAPAAPPGAAELLKLVDRVIRFAQADIDGGR